MAFYAMEAKDHKPNAAYPLLGSWETIMKQLMERKGKSFHKNSLYSQL